MRYAISLLVVGILSFTTFCPIVAGQEATEENGRLVGLKVKALTTKEKRGKLSQELLVVKRSGGRLLANTPDGTLILSGVEPKALTDLMESAMVKAVTEEPSKERFPIENLRLSYDPNKKPSVRELDKMGLTLVEDYKKGSFFIVKSKVPIARSLLSALESEPNITYAAPIMRIKVIEPLKMPKPPAVRGSTLQTPNDPKLSQLWGMANIKAPQAWDRIQGGVTIVAVIDTGIDYQHEDLDGTMWENPLDPIDGNDNDGNGIVDDHYGADFVNLDGDPMDDNSHGTHCAGTVSGIGNNGKGVVGVNWKTPIMALKWIAADGSGTSVDAIKCIDYAVEHGAKVLSNSWWHPHDPELEEAIIRARDAGVLFVAAAGNFSMDNDDPNNYYRYPSSYDAENIISVAAIDPSEKMAQFSDFGAKCVDLAAPGVDVLSSVPGNQYDSYSGTSMATPHVAGAAALVWNLSSSGSMSWSKIKETILSHARPLPSMSGKCVTGGTLDIAFINNGGNDPSPEKCCVAVAGAAFGWDEFKAVSSNANIAETTINLDQESNVLIRCSTSARSISPVTFSTGTFNAPDVNVMWTDSLRSVTANGSDTSVPIVTDMTIRIPKGEHTIYWKVWMYGGELHFDSGTMQVLAVSASGAPAIATLKAAPVTQFDKKNRQPMTDRK